MNFKTILGCLAKEFQSPERAPDKDYSTTGRVLQNLIYSGQKTAGEGG